MIRVGIAGTGTMAHSHARALTAMRGVRLEAACDLREDAGQSFARTYRIPQIYTSIDEMVKRADIEAVICVASDSAHAPISLAAIRAGKHVLCEKPLAVNHADARKMAQAAKRKGVVHMVNFSYRNAPAIHHAAKLISEGAIGTPRHVHGSYLQSWLVQDKWGDWRKELNRLWRLSSKHGSLGVLGDLGVHLLDFATFPIGPVASVRCKLKTFPKHPRNRIGEYVLDANDSAVITVEFKNGSLGVLHTSRWTAGYINRVAAEFYGEEGGIRVDLDKSTHEIQICRGQDLERSAWKIRRSPKTPSVWTRFFHSIRNGGQEQPDFARGAEIQKILDACLVADREDQTVRV